MGLSTGCLTTWELRANTQDQSHSLFISLSQVWHLLTLAIFCSLSVQFSHSVMSNSMWPHGLQHARLPCPSPTPRACSKSCPSSRWCHQSSSVFILFLSSVIPFSSCLNLSQNQGLFQWVGLSHQVAKVLEFQLQHHPFQWIFRTYFL